DLRELEPKRASAARIGHSLERLFVECKQARPLGRRPADPIKRIEGGGVRIVEGKRALVEHRRILEALGTLRLHELRDGGITDRSCVGVRYAIGLTALEVDHQ